MDDSDTGLGAVQEQEEDGRVIAYTSKALNASQQTYCTNNKELLTVVTAMELFKYMYYLTGRHIMVVTDHASLTWLQNFKEPEGVVACWITRLQPFDFKIVHRPGKHHRHADGLSRRASRPCKRDTCPECAALLHQVTPSVKPCYRARATGEAKKAGPALQALIDLSNMEIALAQEQDLNLQVFMDMLRASSERPAWEHVRAESAEIKTLWSQYFSLKIQDGVLLRRRKNQGFLDECQVMAPQTILTRIFQACHHHKLAAHQGVVLTQALIKRWFYWPSMQKNIKSWCQRCTICGKCKAAVRGHS